MDNLIPVQFNMYSSLQDVTWFRIFMSRIITDERCLNIVKETMESYSGLIFTGYDPFNNSIDFRRNKKSKTTDVPYVDIIFKLLTHPAVIGTIESIISQDDSICMMYPQYIQLISNEYICRSVIANSITVLWFDVERRIGRMVL